jgi:hypothetical protein
MPSRPEVVSPGPFGIQLFIRTDGGIPARHARQAPRGRRRPPRHGPCGKARPWLAHPVRAGPSRAQARRAPGEGVEKRITIAAPETAVHLGDLPAAPGRLGIVHPEQVVAQPSRYQGQPAEQHRDRQSGGRPDAGANPDTLAGSAAGRGEGRPGGPRRPPHWLGRWPRGVVFAGEVGNVDHSTSPSCSLLSLGGVSLGRCCSTGPALCPGYHAVGNCRDAGSLRWPPRMLSHGPCASAQGKRMRSLRADGNGSASSLTWPVRGGRRRSLRAGLKRHAICPR